MRDQRKAEEQMRTSMVMKTGRTSVSDASDGRHITRIEPPHHEHVALNSVVDASSCLSRGTVRGEEQTLRWRRRSSTLHGSFRIARTWMGCSPRINKAQMSRFEPSAPWLAYPHSQAARPGHSHTVGHHYTPAGSWQHKPARAG